MTNKTRDELLLAIASGLEVLVAQIKSEDAHDSSMRLLKWYHRGWKENNAEEDKNACQATSPISGSH